MHASEPLTFLYVPVSHWMQGKPLGPLKPALHEQFNESVLPTAEKELLGHVWQTVAAEEFENMPPGHC